MEQTTEGRYRWKWRWDLKELLGLRAVVSRYRKALWCPDGRTWMGGRRCVQMVTCLKALTSSGRRVLNAQPAISA